MYLGQKYARENYGQKITQPRNHFLPVPHDSVNELNYTAEKSKSAQIEPDSRLQDVPDAGPVEQPLHPQLRPRPVGRRRRRAVRSPVGSSRVAAAAPVRPSPVQPHAVENQLGELE